jgi:hypothetical protein
MFSEGDGPQVPKAMPSTVPVGVGVELLPQFARLNPAKARKATDLGLQPSESWSFKTRKNLASVRHQKHEVYGLASHFGSTSLGPIEVCRHQAATPLRFGMDEHSTSPPIGVQDKGHGGWLRINIEAERPEGVSTVHEDITQPHRLGKSGETQSPLGRHAKTISQLHHGHVTELFGRVAHRSIRSQSAPKEDAREREGSHFSASHKVGQHVTHPPTRAPRRCVPRPLIEQFNLVGESEAQTGDLLWHIDSLHDPESCKSRAARLRHCPYAGSGCHEPNA